MTAHLHPTSRRQLLRHSLERAVAASALRPLATPASGATMATRGGPYVDASVDLPEPVRSKIERGNAAMLLKIST